MDLKLELLIEENRNILDKMIEDGVSYEKILKQSQVLDKYVLLGFKAIN